ncbi:MAG: hypothetical protein KF760_35520 [Candidatus Eremiobacteraeota bacterium]|nr:hypothetical protein [Candidatus Eremiobacteraeota bacterium]MCW5872062.1 hypothetical protein [Candidatus Eremiobacteraeota bacterium]
MKRRQAFSLGNTVVVIAVASTLAFTVAAASLNHLNYSNRVSNGIQAQNIAESTLALVTEKLLNEKSEDLGKLREAGSSFTFQLNGGQGFITFNPDQAGKWELPYSTNNLDGPNPVPGYTATKPIPQNSAQLIARGTIGGVSRQVECILYIPPFPYAVATAGPFHSTGKLVVGALDDALPDGEKPAPEEILKANLASNSRDAKALVLGPDSRVSGDVRSAGGVETDETVYIGGRIRPGSDPVKLPQETVTNYDPEHFYDPKTNSYTTRPNLQKVPPGLNNSPKVSGFAKCTGDLNVKGGLELDGGVLYVDGNVIIDGGIRGKGALFVTRDLGLYGSTQMKTDNKVAVVSGGNVSIFGSGQESSMFQGMLWNKGAFSAQHITLMGVLIQADENATTDINDASLYYQSSQGKLDMTISSPGSVDVTKGNIHISALGLPITGIVTGSAVFEVYPTTAADGHWEVVDPNSRQIYSVPNKAAVRDKVKEIWNGSTSGGLVGVGPGGSGVLVVPLTVLGPLFWPNYNAELNDIPAREPGASQMLTPGSSERITIDPNQLLSRKDKVRLLYWRAR